MDVIAVSEMKADLGTVHLKKPRILGYEQTPQGLRVHFQPYFLLAPDVDVDIFIDHIATWIDAPTQIANNYVEATSGIKIMGTMPKESGKIIEGDFKRH